ncbi:sugar O-acetyltransferase [Pseudoalteromonas sp. SG43-4]|uniref:sugar O-acetyltransferase n=1 Tax=Pseudoalteromonas sp. SG43-4 TaxID=2760969 RepID=UPI001603ADB6|nr:sugar O-acetyltransferase [Pseudoalteromonas sp. SG43-4]MBB1431477.1 sugar O-acetyltransferase [Pseudoalteromonas sp. SG43-4]
MKLFNSVTKPYLMQRKQTGEICRLFNKSPSKGNLKRIKELFAQCGEEVIIESGFHCDYGNQIVIGDRTFMNVNCTLLDSPLANYSITIGNDCLIGPNVQLLAVSHATNPAERFNKENFAAPIALGNNVWIGAGAIILAGVNIGENSIVGAGAVVTKNVMANTVVAGNPAREIRTL